MSRLPAICALVLVAALAGCSAPATSPQTAPPGSSPSVPSPGDPAVGGPAAGGPSAGVPAVGDEPPGTLACGKISAAVRDGTMMQPGVVSDVRGSAATADAPVADAAARLQDAYDRAVRARGSEDEPDLVAGVSAAAAEMVSVCSDSGLETVG